MNGHIDVGTVLRRTVCDLYSDLVTRPTGAAVRTGIEQQLAELADRTVTIIDFAHVGLLDFSCADEIVAKLLLRIPTGGTRDAYFLFRGVSDSHLEAIEVVLERHGLAAVAQGDNGELMLLGDLGDTQRQAWDAINRLGRGDLAEVARESDIPADAASQVLDDLWRRRLIMRTDQWYVALAATA
ncbi:MAG: hypothetical protein H7Z74_03985 [Anaerolineae bacterium]|nr:hypothetical protein [Gemmatimonadaceae bacterium]